MSEAFALADTELAHDDGLLNAPGRCALFLDLDGTLLEMASSPETVRVPSGLTTLLQILSERMGGALAILTGRQVIEADRLLDPLKLPGSGVHGAQVRRVRDGEIETSSPELPEELVAQLVALEGKMPGIRAEAKGPGFAVHYRVVPHVQPELETTLRRLLADYASNVVLSRGRKIFEIVPIGTTKGTSLAAFCAQPDFAGRKPVMIGDDVGDEPAFAAAVRLGGAGLRVAGEHFGRDAANLSGPSEVFQLLTRVMQRLQQGG